MARIRRLSLSNSKFQFKNRPLRKGRLERLESSSRYLSNSRYLDIYLPPHYDREQRHYPVLYMHDGNNLFYPEIAFGGTPWYLQRSLDHLISVRLIEPMIVVGVYNSMGRAQEYTWSPMKTPWGQEGGQGPDYARYLRHEVMPQINRRYRTLLGPQHTGVMGSSLGGLISFYLGLHHSDVFGHIGMISPSFWWNAGEALRDAQDFPPGLRLWLDMGTREGDRRVAVKRNPNVRNLRLMKQALLQRGYREGLDLGYLEARGALHNEWWWGQRSHLILLFLFGSEAARRRILAE